MKLNTKKLSLAFSLTWGLFVLSIGWTAAIGWGNHALVNTMSGLYIGFKASFLGGIIGGLWGLVDGFIGGFLVSMFYNRVLSKIK